jgi:hypothetical protein
MSASVAANDIWKLGCATASGANASTTSAAIVTERKVNTGRSSITSIKTIAIMMNDLCVATSAPESTR